MTPFYISITAERNTLVYQYISQQRTHAS